MTVGIDRDICNKLKCPNYHYEYDEWEEIVRCKLISGWKDKVMRMVFFRREDFKNKRIPKDCPYRNVMILSSKKE